jgi:putative hydrolase of the HAD superfamily
MTKIEGLVFDFDGLILDTELPNLHAWQEVYRAFGYELPFEKYILVVGTDESAFNPITYLSNLLGGEIDEAMISSMHKDFLYKYLSTSELMPGVRNYLRDARSAGLRTAIASSSNDGWVLGHLTRLNCLDAFDEIVTAGSVLPPNPDPTVYGVALDKLGIDPSEAIAFEDSLNGVKSARKAGIFCVAVPNSVTVNMDFFESNLQIPSLLTINLLDLVKIAESM